MGFDMIKRTVRKIMRMFGMANPNRGRSTQLDEVPRIACESARLGFASRSQVFGWFSSSEMSARWAAVEPEILALELPELTGGVNQGDQRALFSIVMALNPTNVLEIGTHIGCSTVHLAIALRQLQSEGGCRALWTVDIRDVNDPTSRPWEAARSPASPRDLIARTNCRDITSFHVSPSLDFLRRDQEEDFNLIFLDGLHDASMVYREIPLALKRLKPGGLILLHDFFPDGLPLWKDQPAAAGPFQAVTRLQNEGAGLSVLPFGSLPWPTKLSTNITSLALVTRQSE